MEIGYRLMERGRMRPPFLYPVETKDTVWNVVETKDTVWDVTKVINCSSVIELAPSYKINTLIFKRLYA